MIEEREESSGVSGAPIPRPPLSPPAPLLTSGLSQLCSQSSFPEACKPARWALRPSCQPRCRLQGLERNGQLGPPPPLLLPPRGIPRVRSTRPSLPPQSRPMQPTLSRCPLQAPFFLERSGSGCHPCLHSGRHPWTGPQTWGPRGCSDWATRKPGERPQEAGTGACPFAAWKGRAAGRDVGFLFPLSLPQCPGCGRAPDLWPGAQFCYCARAVE